MPRQRNFVPASLVVAGVVLMTASPALMLLAVRLPLPWGGLATSARPMAPSRP
jgi:hypothetical protein